MILQMGVALDGYVAGPDGDPGWGLPPEDEAVTAWKLGALDRVGTHIMGRVTHQAMAAHWPTSTAAYAAKMNDTPKVVFSRSLPSANWPGSRIARGDLAGEIDTLRREPGGDIMATAAPRSSRPCRGTISSTSTTSSSAPSRWAAGCRCSRTSPRRCC